MKCGIHQNAIALTFARTETKMFQRYVFPVAHSILFIYGRLGFYHVTGKKAGSAGAPSVLIAYGENNSRVLKNCEIKGYYLKLR